MVVRLRSANLLAASLAIVILIVAPASASESDHKYQPDDPVTLWVNKVGPYNNPQETYNYYSLPFCQPRENPSHKWGGLGEVLGGNELIDSQIELKFLKNVEKGSICSIELDDAKVKQFTDAIDTSYWFEFFIDDLPLWAFVGETGKTDTSKHYLFTHKSIVVRYNKDQIIHVNITQGNPRLLESGKKLDMTFSVNWTPTNITFAHRFDVYLDYPFFEHQESDVCEESGWKLVHGDLFRPPRNLVLLFALIESKSFKWPRRGAIHTTSILCYAFTSLILGYVSGGLYCRNGGKILIKSMILTPSLFPFMSFGICIAINTSAIFYRSLAAIPFGTMVVVFLILTFISFPLALLGNVVSRNWSGALAIHAV